MKKIIFIGILTFLAGNVFCQATMDKDQQKKVKDIHKEVVKKHADILKDPNITADEKKRRVDVTKSERDAKLSALLNSDQVNAVKAKDPISWDKMYLKIEKQEKAKLKAERDQRLREVDSQIRDVNSQNDDVKRQMNDLKRKQKDLNDQQKILKAKKKAINAEYK